VRDFEIRFLFNDSPRLPYIELIELTNNHCNFRPCLLLPFIFHTRRAYNMVNSRAQTLHCHQTNKIKRPMIENKKLLYKRREFRFFYYSSYDYVLPYASHINLIEIINTLCNSFIINTRPPEFNICQWQRA